MVSRYIHIPNLRILCRIIYNKICSVRLLYTIEVRCQGHSCRKVICYNLKIKMHVRTKFEIVTSNNLGVCLGNDFSSIEAIGQGHSDLKQYVTFQYPNRYPLYGTSMPYNIGDNIMLHTRF